MDGLATPYEDDSETEFMECSVCDVYVKGLDLFKIHVTTPGHLKKEDAAAVAAEYKVLSWLWQLNRNKIHDQPVARNGGGHMIRKQIIPKFDDILQYVDYLNLDEPVIGLNFLEEVPCVNAAHATMGPRYTCTLCNTTGYPPEMIHHVIGRRHRQKYIENKRPDLISWDKHLVMPTGKIIRTRAEIIARQDGSGRPKPMKKMQNVGNRMTRVPPWQMPEVDPPNISGQLQWKQKSHDTDRGSFLPDPVSRAPFVPAEARPMNMAGGRQVTSLWDQQPAKADGWERFPLQGKNLDLDYRFHNDVTQKRMVEPYKETQRGWNRPAEGYTTYEEQGAKNEFLTEEGRHQFQPPCLDFQQRPGFQGDDQQWSADNDRGVRLGKNVPKPPTRNVRFPSDKPVAQFTDYNHGMRPAKSFSAGAANSRTPQEVSRSMSAIPEPFRRFMRGPAGDEVSVRRKRKSRFSDATPEEVVVANRMLNAGPRDAKLRAPLESGGGTFQQETRRTMRHPDRFKHSRQNNPGLLQTPSQCDKTFQEESHFRRAEDCYGGEGNGGGRDWNNTRDAHQVDQHQGCNEPSELNSNRYKADFGQQQMYTTSRLDEQAQFPQQFQGGGQQRLQFQQCDHQQSYKSFFDSRSPPLDMERPVGLHRKPQYSKSLQKLTSTILELLSRNSSLQ